MKISDINIRDPFALTHNGKYYMYGSRAVEQFGFDVYISSDLENWSEPKSIFERTEDFWGVKDFWAPEVHEYNGKLNGKWTVSDNLIFDDDGGHGMIFTALDGEEYFIFHKPNHPSTAERPVLISLTAKEIIEKC